MVRYLIDKTKYNLLYEDIKTIKKNRFRNTLKTLRIDLTTKCNLNCEYCLYRSEKSIIKDIDSKIYEIDKIISFEDLVKIIDFFKKREIKSIIITGGGEPFIHPQIDQIISYILRKRIYLGIITNGLLIKDEFIKKVKKSKYFKWIRISVNSATKKTYNKFHKPLNPNSYDIVINNIKKLSSIKNRKFIIGLNYVVTPCNYAEMIEFANLAKELKVDNIRFTPVYTNQKEKTFLPFKKELNAIITQLEKIKDIQIKIQKDRFAKLSQPNTTKKCYFSLFSVNLGVNKKLYPCCLKKYVSKGILYNKLDEYYKSRHKFKAYCKECMYIDFNNYCENQFDFNDFEYFIP